MAIAQLQLNSAPTEWKLDRRTIEIGRAGLAKARQALAEAAPVIPTDDEESALFTSPNSVSTNQATHPQSRKSVRQPRISEGQGSLALFAA